MDDDESQESAVPPPPREEPQPEAAEPSFIVLESGRIRFYVRPRVEVITPSSFADVQRFFFTLAPARLPARRIVIGKKRLPDPRDRERHWAYVDRVGSAADVVADLGASTYSTKSRGLRHQAAAVEVATGRYAIASHRDHVHLLYALDGDPDTSVLLHQLRLASRASYVAAAFHPSPQVRGGRAGATLTEEDAPLSAAWPHDDAAVARWFDDRRFVPLAPSALDVVGAELVLISGERVKTAALSEAWPR